MMIDFVDLISTRNHQLETISTENDNLTFPIEFNLAVWPLPSLPSLPSLGYPTVETLSIA
jgi:hypothetical protein